MNIDQFLNYWSAHNIGIIEALIAAILFAVVFLSYRILFSKKDASGMDSAANIDTTQIEKTLQKILDAQTSGAAVAKAASASGEGGPALEPTAHLSEAGTAASPELVAEVAQLKAALQEKTVQVEQLKAQATEGGGAAAAAAGPSLSADEKAALENKIKDLEARLSEYEIISEDIADLSRYKEENIRLQKELDALKAMAGTGAAAPAPAEPAPVAKAPEPPAPAAEPAAPAAEAAPADDSANVIDDELMKEFAAAVEGQKSGQVSNETDKLMNDFENFVKKG